MTNFVKNIGVVMEMDPQSCICVRIRCVCLKLLGIQKSSINPTTHQGSRLNYPPISKMFNTIQYGFSYIYRVLKNGHLQFSNVVKFNQKKANLVQLVISHFTDLISDHFAFYLPKNTLFTSLSPLPSSTLPSLLFLFLLS